MINCLITFVLLIKPVKYSVLIGDKILMLKHERWKTSNGRRFTLLAGELLLERININIFKRHTKITPQALDEVSQRNIMTIVKKSPYTFDQRDKAISLRTGN